MSWHYQAKKGIIDGELQYYLVESYPSIEVEEGTVVAHTEAHPIIAESKEDLAKWLRLAADDVERFDAIGEEV